MGQGSSKCYTKPDGARVVGAVSVFIFFWLRTPLRSETSIPQIAIDPDFKYPLHDSVRSKLPGHKADTQFTTRTTSPENDVVLQYFISLHSNQLDQCVCLFLLRRMSFCREGEIL